LNIGRRKVKTDDHFLSVLYILFHSPAEIGNHKINGMKQSIPKFRIRLLHPVDFVIAKLRRGTEQDLEDAQEVAIRFYLSPADIQVAADSAIQAPPKDTAPFTFRKTVDIFCQRIGQA